MYRGSRGFTLVELMITVVIVGIGVALAVPSWDNAVQKRNTTKAAEEIASETETVSGNPMGPLQQADSLTVALRSLPGDRQAILALRYVEGFGVNEISTILKIPPGTVKSRLYHARNQLKQIMEEEEHE